MGEAGGADCTGLTPNAGVTTMPCLLCLAVKPRDEKTRNTCVCACLSEASLGRSHPLARIPGTGRATRLPGAADKASSRVSFFFIYPTLVC